MWRSWGLWPPIASAASRRWTYRSSCGASAMRASAPGSSSRPSAPAASPRARLALSALGDDGHLQREITSLPITLHKGVQPVPLTFQSDTQMRKLQFTIEPQENEISTANNHFTTEIGIDRTKIRVLYVEG